MSTHLIQGQNSGIMDFSKFENAWKACELIASSSFCPKDFRGKPGDVLCAIQYGSEIGLLPMQALQGIAVINGKPSVYGDTLLALCQASPDCEYIIEEYNEETETAVCKVKRKGHPEAVRTFSKIDAQFAGLLNKEGPWRLYKKRMMQMRARGFCLRDEFAYLLMGIITIEEARDYPSNQSNSQKVIPIIHAVKFIEPVQVSSTSRIALTDFTLKHLRFLIFEIELSEDNKESGFEKKILSWAKIEQLNELSEEQAILIIKKLEKKYPMAASAWQESGRSVREEIDDEMDEADLNLQADEDEGSENGS